MASPEPVFISTRAELIAFAARLDGVKEVGFDTEFHAEQTYRPKVMLLQLSTRDEVALIDPLAQEVKGAIGGFLELIKMREQLVIGHALEHDLELFFRLNGGLPARVFDTQRAAAFAGMGGPISLGALLQARLGVEVDKVYSRADWGRRPLPPAQAEYAADDVRYIHALADDLRAQLEPAGRMAWLEEEMQALLRPEAYLPADPSGAWRRVSRKPTAGSRAHLVMQHVAAERERIAQETDRPARKVLPDEVVVDLARRAPRKAADLEGDARRRPAPSLDKYADRWIEAIELGLEAELDGAADAKQVPPPEVAAAAELLKGASAWLAKKEGVAEWYLDGLASQLESVASDPPSSAEALRRVLGLRGWRAELLVEPLWRLLSGEGSLRFSRGPEGVGAELS